MQFKKKKRHETFAKKIAYENQIDHLNLNCEGDDDND
jgi:hypothetical protein